MKHQNRVAYAYHMVMGRTQTLVQLTDELLTLLDEEASRRGVSRSALIREAIEAHLAETTNAIKRWRTGYERIPATAPDKWGTLEAITDAATDEMLQGLDKDEPS